MRLLEECSTLYTGSAFRVSVIRAKLVYLSITSKQARVALCHDLAKWLSHYLYFFLFLFLFFSFLGLTTTRWSVGKYDVTLSQCHNGMMDGHVTGHSHSVSHD